MDTKMTTPNPEKEEQHAGTETPVDTGLSRGSDHQPAEYLNTKEAAEVLRRPISTLYFWRKRGIGPPSYRLGKQCVYPRPALDQWIEQHRDSAA
jgi:predicted DNA-binding transcriptional regulator AlpA